MQPTNQELIQLKIFTHEDFGDIEVRFTKNKEPKILSAGTVDDLHVEIEDLDQDLIDWLISEIVNDTNNCGET